MAAAATAVKLLILPYAAAAGGDCRRLQEATTMSSSSSSSSVWTSKLTSEAFAVILLFKAKALKCPFYGLIEAIRKAKLFSSSDPQCSNAADGRRRRGVSTFNAIIKASSSSLLYTIPIRYDLPLLPHNLYNRFCRERRSEQSSSGLWMPSSLKFFVSWTFFFL